MNDLLKKLNTLVRASINDLPNAIRRGALPPDADAQIKDLRERINAAVEHEDHLAETVRILRAEVDKLDTRVDQAVADGRDEDARMALEQFESSRKRLDAAEADFAAHQAAARDLIERVNMLDSAVSESRQAQDEDTTGDPPTMQRIADLIRDTRERINARMEPAPPADAVEDPEAASNPKSDDDDLADRLQRLSKPQ